MFTLFRWVEESSLSVWIRESTSILGYPAILSAHAIGMAVAVGLNLVLALRLLGVSPATPMGELRRYVGLIWSGFWLNAVSGLILLIAYPTKALTNPIFYLKLALIGVGMGAFMIMGRRLWQRPGGDAWAQRSGRALAITALVCWTAAIIAGRLLAYTHRYLMADF